MRRREAGSLLALAVAAFGGCGSDEGGGGSDAEEKGRPTEVARDYLAASGDKDCERWAALMSDDYVEAQWETREGAVETCVAYPGGSGETTYDFVEESIDGDEALVKYDWSNTNGGSSTEALELVLVDGDWLVDGHLTALDLEE